MKFILGTKEKMEQVFDDKGNVVPVTIIKTESMVVTQVKTAEKDKYGAIQFGVGSKKASQSKKPQRAKAEKLGLETSFRLFKEFRTDETANVGDKVDASVFSEGDAVTVSGVSKGKGFQGVVKRHGFSGGPRTHGQKHSEREPGSIGGGLRTRVPKGMRMAGRMGSDRVTVKGLKVVKIDKENNKIFVSGAVPGKRGTLLEIYGS